MTGTAEHKWLVFRFSGIEVQEKELRVLRAGEPIAIEPKAFKVLVCLLRNPGQLVGKDELIRAAWGQTAVTDNSLSRAIAYLRRKLEDDTREPRYIETVSTAGYRFVGWIETREDSGGGGAGPILSTRSGDTAKAINQGRKEHSKRLMAAMATIALLGFGIWNFRAPLPAPHITQYTQITHDAQVKMLAGTDGTRLYFNQFQPKMVSQVTVAGGTITTVPLPVRDPFVEDVSEDGSTLLVASGNPGDIWSVGALGDPLRHLAKADVDATALSTATWSPDGRFIAFSTQNGEIYRVRSDGSELEKLSPADPKGIAWSLTWSPDGDKLRFTRDLELWEMSSHGSNPRKLLQDWDTSDWKCCGRWTPDGAFYIFVSSSTPNSYSGEKLWAIDERSRFLRRPAPQPIQLTSGPIRWGSPFPSRDGRTIFARGATLRGELDQWNSKTKQFQLYLGGISSEFVSFSRDGKSVAYVSFPEGVLWKANRDGSNPIQLTAPPLRPQGIAWSPDGTQIIFYDKPIGFSDKPSGGSYPETYLVPSQGGKPERLRVEGNKPVIGANWSPDGRRIVFETCECVESYFSDRSIRILDIDSHKITMIPGSEGVAAPQWSPDGRYIVALSTGPLLDPKVYDVTTRNWIVLPVGDVDWPAWSKDSQSIYFLRRVKDPAVIRVVMPTRKVENVIDLHNFQMTGWYSNWFGLDPNDTPLLLRNLGSEELYALTLEQK